MTAAVAANVAVLAGIFVVGFAIDRRVRSGAKLRALSMPLQLLGGGVAVGPVDGLVGSLAVSVALWIAVPAVLSRVTGTIPTEPGVRC